MDFFLPSFSLPSSPSLPNFIDTLKYYACEVFTAFYSQLLRSRRPLYSTTSPILHPNLTQFFAHISPIFSALDLLVTRYTCPRYISLPHNRGTRVNGIVTRAPQLQPPMLQLPPASSLGTAHPHTCCYRYRATSSLEGTTTHGTQVEVVGTANDKVMPVFIQVSFDELTC